MNCDERRNEEFIRENSNLDDTCESQELDAEDLISQIDLICQVSSASKSIKK